MKKKLTLFFLFVMMGCVGFAQNPVIVTGYVHNSLAMTPIANHPVFIGMDSTLNQGIYYNNWVYTDVNGFYMDTIFLSNIMQGYVTVGTSDCNGIFQDTLISFSPSNTNISNDFYICGDTTATCQTEFTFYTDSTDSQLFHFYDLSGSTVNSWFWDFGDSTGSMQQSPDHQFQQAGTYTVCLTVYTLDSTGTVICSGNICHQVTVSAFCSASFNYLQDSCSYCAVFASTSVYTGMQQCAWNFGDGSSGTGDVVNHCFNSNGIYIVTLNIISGNGCTSTFTDSIAILPVMPFTAGFSYNIDPDENIPNAMQFFNNSSASAVSWQWDFGDGSTSTLENPEHLFADSGSYNVCLSISNGICEDVVCQTISISGMNVYNMGGQVFDSEHLPIQQGNAYLYSVYGEQVTLCDSMYFSSLGYYYFYYKPKGHYILKVVPLPANVEEYAYAPTYFGDKLFWDEATVIDLNDSLYSNDLFLIPAISVSGPGSITGATLLNTGDIKPSSEVVLRDTEGKVISYKYSDISGNFSFGNLAYGTYILKADEAGMKTMADTITISAEYPDAYVQLTLQQQGPLGLYAFPLEYSEIQTGEIFPNPVSDKIFIEVNLIKSQDLIFDIYTVTGQRLILQKFHMAGGSNMIEFPVDAFPSGPYILLIYTNDSGYFSCKKFIK